MKANDLSNYYERDPKSRKMDDAVRYPRNYVKFSPLTKPLQWIDAIAGLFGSGAFNLKDAMLKEFDNAAHLDRCLGTDEELKHTREHLESFGDGVDNNPYLSSVGRFILKKLVVDSLKNRKRVLQHYHDNKDFIDAKGNFKSPVIITGAPRTGTTLLYRLMSEDPNTRSPYTYELEAALPPLAADADPMSDPRIKSSGAAMDILSKLAPGFMEKIAESHLWSATEVEESYLYMLLQNGIQYLNQPHAGFEYTKKLFYQLDGKRSIFKYERLFFNMLDAYRPVNSHWTLKSPTYGPYFPSLAEEYADARVLLTHRNPLVTQASLNRMMESWCIVFDKDGTFDKHRFAETQEPYIEQCILMPLRYRREHPEKKSQFFDCVYEEFLADPISMVKKIYDYYDLEYTQEFEDRMKVYLAKNQQGKYGRHIYSMEEYRINAERLFEKFKEYMDHYGYGIPEKIGRKASFDFLENQPG